MAVGPSIPHSSLQAPAGSARVLERDFSQGHGVTGQGAMALN